MAVGAVYVPVDPDYPAERIGYILASSDPALVLTSRTLQMPLDVAAPLVCLDAPGVAEQLAAVELATTAPCELPAPNRKMRPTSSTPPARPVGPKGWW